LHDYQEGLNKAKRTLFNQVLGLIKH